MMDFLYLLRMCWNYSPVETVLSCGVTVVCSVLLALCIIGLVGG